MCHFHGLLLESLALSLADMEEPSLLHFYISREWLNKFNTFTEPGPISNHTFLCQHGGQCCTRYYCYYSMVSFIVFEWYCIFMRGEYGRT